MRAAGGTGADRAATYYDSADATAFYRQAWGGSDIHVGRYESGAESVADASAAMSDHLLSLAGIGPGNRVLDIACGYGGTLRRLARMGCVASGIDISRACVDEARRLNRLAGLDDKIPVAVGDFHQIPGAEASLDACICQESLIHSTDRPRVFAQVFRVLRPCGVFAVSDILTAEDADTAKVDAAFARLGVRAGATPADYRGMARDAGFIVAHSEESLHDIAVHYDKLADALLRLPESFDVAVADRLRASIACWRDAIAGGHITWGALVARKPL